MMAARNGKGPEVPRSEEELEQERLDALEDEQAEAVAMRKRAKENANLFLWCALSAAVLGGGLAYIIAPGAFARGVLMGAVTMCVALFAQTHLLLKLLIGDGGRRGLWGLLLAVSFLGILGVTAWVVRNFQDEALGFGFGLTVPMLAGFIFGAIRRTGGSKD